MQDFIDGVHGGIAVVAEVDDANFSVAVVDLCWRLAGKGRDNEGAKVLGTKGDGVRRNRELIAPATYKSANFSARQRHAMSALMELGQRPDRATPRAAPTGGGSGMKAEARVVAAVTDRTVEGPFAGWKKDER